MKILATVLSLALLPHAMLAQDSTELDLSAISGQVIPDISSDERRAVSARAAVIKGLDTVSGDTQDVEVRVGETARVGRLDVTLGECRYPEDNPSGEAYAWLEITDTLRDTIVFEGWMVASSPALNALDHARYDVWVIRCSNA